MNTITLYNLTELEKPFIKVLMSTLLILTGVISLFSGMYIFSVLLFTFWIMMDLLKHGVEIEFENSKIVKLTKLLGFIIYKRQIRIDANKKNRYRIKKTLQQTRNRFSLNNYNATFSKMYFTIECSFNGNNKFDEILIGDNETIHQLAYDMETTWNFVKVTKK